MYPKPPPDKQTLDEALSFDALATAEKVTGKSYKDDQHTAQVGMGLFMAHNEAKQDLLVANDDTHYGIDYGEADRIITSLGFRDVLVVPFEDRDGEIEHLRILYRRGVLMRFESHHKRVNNLDIYFNLKPHNQSGNWPDHFSGGVVAVKDGKKVDRFDDVTWKNRDFKVYCGSIDVRDGLRHALRKLEQDGEFVTPWVEVPWLWLNTYTEKGDDHDRLRTERLAQLPAEVRHELGLPNA